MVTSRSIFDQNKVGRSEFQISGRLNWTQGCQRLDKTLERNYYSETLIFFYQIVFYLLFIAILTFWFSI